MRTAGVQRRLLPAVIASGLLFFGLPDGPRAEPAAADEAELTYFLGRWATEPAERPGFETIIARGADCERPVEIVSTSPGSIVRSVPRRDGSRPMARFSVKRFGRDFPWWPEPTGPGLVARKLDDGGFLLAGLVAGRADWNNAIRHRRCR